MKRQPDYGSTHKKILAWYRKHGRHELPWRHTDDPYRIWISEIMLQQTQVKTVLERFYHPFLDLFPTVEALAAAQRRKVMKAWEGLGYYNRAANLHEAAKKIVSIQYSVFGIQGKKSKKSLNIEYRIPNTLDALLSLPGIGRNTAHAILAFAYRQPMPVMEANVKRILCRVFALQNPTTDELWKKAEAPLDRKNPFDYNQAMMDIGSLVCTKRNPDCPACPLNEICKGKSSPESYPAPVKKKQVPVRHRILLVMEYDRKYYLEKRKGKFLNGLWGFPEFDYCHPREGGDPKLHSPDIQAWIPAFAGMTKLGEITQTYSHFRLEAEVQLIQLKKPHKKTGWHSLKEIQRLPLSKADLKVLDFLKS